MRANPPALPEPPNGAAAWHRAVLALVLGCAACLALRQVDSLDVGFHLKAGEHVLAGRGWPRTDPFSYAMGDHAYVDTSWGYQVVIAAVQRAFGPAGLVLLHAGLVLATCVLLWRTARAAGADADVLSVLLFLGMLACELRFAVRPELVSYLLLALLVSWLERRAAGQRVRLAWLVPLFLAWASLHSLFVLGWGALACFVVGLWLRDRRLDRPLAGWSLAAATATLVNPYGLRGVLFPFTLLTRFDSANPFQQEIGEFVSPFDSAAFDAQPFYPWAPVWAFRCLALLAALALPVLLARRRWWGALLLLLFAWPAVRMVRNTPLLVVAGLPSTAVAWSFLCAQRRRALRAALALVAVLSLAFAWRATTDAYYIASRRAERFGLGWNRAVLPVDAVEYVQRAGLSGRPLNHLNFGGWLMWAGGEPTFIDGRLEVVGEAFYREYRAAFSAQDAFEATAVRWAAGWTIFPYASFPQLLGRVSADPRWRLAYADPVAALFVRNEPEAERFVDPALPGRAPAAPLALDDLPGFPAGPPRPGRIARFTTGFLGREVFPSAHHCLGLFHLYRGELEHSAARFAAAIRASDGRYYELYANLGAVLFRMKHWSEARRCYELVLAEHPEHALARERLNEVERALLRR